MKNRLKDAAVIALGIYLGVTALAITAAIITAILGAVAINSIANELEKTSASAPAPVYTPSSAADLQADADRIAQNRQWSQNQSTATSSPTPTYTPSALPSINLDDLPTYPFDGDPDGPEANADEGDGSIDGHSNPYN